MKKYLTVFLLVLAGNTLAATAAYSPARPAYDNGTYNAWDSYPHSEPVPVSYPHSDPTPAIPTAPPKSPMVQSLTRNQPDAPSIFNQYRPQTPIDKNRREAHNKDLMFLGNSCGC